MNEWERQKRRNRQGGHRDRRPSWRWAKQQQIEGSRVPDRRKAAKIVARHLHLPVGKIDRAGHHDGNAGDWRQQLRQQPAIGNGKRGHEDVGHEIDHEVERISGPARKYCCDMETTGQRPVDRIDNQRDTQPQEHRRPGAIDRGQQRQKRERCTRSRENMDGEPAGTLSHGRLVRGLLELGHGASFTGTLRMT